MNTNSLNIMNKYLSGILLFLLSCLCYIGTIYFLRENTPILYELPQINIVIQNDKTQQKVVLDTHVCSHMNWGDLINLQSQNPLSTIILYCNNERHVFYYPMMSNGITWKEDASGILREKQTGIPLHEYEGINPLWNMDHVAAILQFKKDTSLPRIMCHLMELKKRGFKNFMYLK